MGIMKRVRNIGINGTTSPSYRPDTDNAEVRIRRKWETRRPMKRARKKARGEVCCE
jgi:hypothetical protein